ncbi:MAG: OmpH family outer membrane protein [Bacteroidetes bacterium]|nr:OmpH family outer membrane protein [Bacteroidota bacterium]
MTEEIDNTPTGNNPEEPQANQPQSYPLQEQDVVIERQHPSKNWLLILNLVLVVGLAVLYFLFFSEKGKDRGASMEQVVAKAKNGSMSAAFINNDSILANYDLVKKLKAALQAKGDRLLAEVASKQKAFDKDAAYFQDQVQKKSISEQSAQEIYASLTENQQKINDLRAQYSDEIQKDEVDMNVVLLDSVMNFLKRYNTRYKFDYILGFNKGGNILYANDTLDITKDVIRELNKEYHEKVK